MVITQFNLYKHVYFYKYAHNSGPKGFPGMILSAFHMKFNAWKNGIPPRACRLSPPKPQKSKKNIMRKWVPRPPVRSSGGPGGADLGAEKKGRGEHRHPCPLFIIILMHLW